MHRLPKELSNSSVSNVWKPDDLSSTFNLINLLKKRTRKLEEHLGYRCRKRERYGGKERREYLSIPKTLQKSKRSRIGLREIKQENK